MPRYENNPFTKQMERRDNDGFVSPVVTSNTTLTLDQEYVEVDASSGTIILYLPKLSEKTLGKKYNIVRIDNHREYQVIIRCQTGDNILGDSELILRYQHDAPCIVGCKNLTWRLF